MILLVISRCFHLGYGLGYTKFEIAESKVVTENGVLKDDSEITVEAVIKILENFQERVVQVYICAPQTELDKPYQELKGYRKTKELCQCRREGFHSNTNREFSLI